MGCAAVSELPPQTHAGAEHAGPVGRDAETLAHDPRPQPPSRPVLGDLLEEVRVHVEEEAQLAADLLDVEAALDDSASTYVIASASVKASSCTALAARVAEVGTGDGDGVEAGRSLQAELDRVRDQSQRGLRTERSTCRGPRTP